MSYTYDGEQLGTALNEIRLIIGDTTADVQGVMRFTDEEILAYAPGGVLAESSNISAAARLCDILEARYTGMVDVSEGSASASMSQLAAQYRKLAMRLRSRSISMAWPPTGSCSPGPAFTRQSGDPTYIVPVDVDYCTS